MKRPHRRTPTALLALALLPVLAGCDGEQGTTGGTTTTTTPGKTVTLLAGDISLTAGPTGLVLERGTTPLLRLPKDAFEWGTVPEIEDLNYDPYRIYVSYPLYSPPDITWLAPAEMEVASSIDTSVTLTLRYPGESTATLTIEVGAPGRFEALWAPDGAAPPIAFHRLRARASAEEGFYGLGEYFDDVNHRGHVRAMQIEVDTSIESSYNEAHVPVPFVTGTQGWGLFVASERPGAFAVAADPAEPDLVEAAFGTAPASADGLRFHLFGAAHPLDVTALHYQVTGKPKVPAPWALGPWVWRDENKDQAEFLSDANTIRDLDLATTAMWIDRPYATAVNTFDFEPAQFPDPEAMIAEAHALGLRLALWHTPYLDEKSQADDTAALRQIAESEGYYPPQSGLLLNKWGRPIDLTNPDAYAFWQSLIEKYGAMGIEGYKLDYMEDIVPGLTNARNEWQFADGTDERTQHSAFQRLYHRVYSETLPDDGGFLLCRAGTWGDQTHASIIWPGDLDATFYKHREVFDDNGEKVSGVGGLPASIVAGLSLGPSGFPFFGADTGGYKHSPPDKELFTRWFEQTAFSTVMQIGTSSNTVAWDPNGGPGFDDEMLGWYREYTRIHLRLFPYLWTHAMALAETGRPIARPLGLAYPEMGIHPNDTYLLGDDLLVAPVVEQGKTSREVAFPPGRWIHFLTGTVHEGGTTETVSAPLGQIPVFLREGGIVPLLRPTIDSLSPTTEPDRVDSFATTVGLLYARTAPAPLSKTAVYDGTALSIDSASATLTLTVNPGTVFTLGAQFEVLTPAAPTEVKDGDSTLPEAPDLQTLESSPAGWYHSAASGGTLHVRVPSGTHTVTATFPN